MECFPLEVVLKEGMELDQVEAKSTESQPGQPCESSSACQARKQGTGSEVSWNSHGMPTSQLSLTCYSANTGPWKAHFDIDFSFSFFSRSGLNTSGLADCCVGHLPKPTAAREGPCICERPTSTGSK